MEAKQIQTTITKLQRNIRDAQRQLIELKDLSSADLKHVHQAQRSLSEHLEILLDLKEEVMRSINSAGLFVASPCPESTSPEYCPPTQITTEKRARGGQKQYYLLDNSKRQEYVARIRSLFGKYYDNTPRKFVLPDGTWVRTSVFLACVYDLGIKDGIASIDAPVKDFAEMVTESAKDIPTFNTAYNTIQHAIKSWREYIGDKAYYDRTVHLFSINPDTVLPKYKDNYNESMETMNKVAQCLMS